MSVSKVSEKVFQRVVGVAKVVAAVKEGRKMGAEIRLPVDAENPWTCLIFRDGSELHLMTQPLKARKVTFDAIPDCEANTLAQQTGIKLTGVD